MTQLTGFWNQTFKFIPTYAIPDNIPEGIDPEQLIRLVQLRQDEVLRKWQNGIRYEWMLGRLAAAEDGCTDEEYRSDTLRIDIQTALSRLWLTW